MWIKMKRDQAKSWGVFGRGQVHSLTQEMVDKLDKDSYEVIAMDERTMEKRGVEDRMKHFSAEIAMIDSSVKSANQRLGDLKQRRKMLTDKLKAASEDLKRIEAEAEAEGTDDGKSETAEQPAGEPAAAEAAAKGN